MGVEPLKTEPELALIRLFPGREAVFSMQGMEPALGVLLPVSVQGCYSRVPGTQQSYPVTRCLGMQHGVFDL